MNFQVQCLHFFSEHLDWVKEQSRGELPWTLIFKDALDRWQYWRIQQGQIQGYSSWDSWEANSTSLVLVYAHEESWKEASHLLQGLSFSPITFYSPGCLNSPLLGAGLRYGWWWKSLLFYILIKGLTGRDKFVAMEYKLSGRHMLKKIVDFYWRGWLREFLA